MIESCKKITNRLKETLCLKWYKKFKTHTSVEDKVEKRGMSLILTYEI